MKWVELAKVSLPKGAVVVQVEPFRSSSLVVYHHPGQSYQPRWFLARWEHQGAFTWALECKGYPQVLAVEDGLILVQQGTRASAAPALYAIRFDTGSEVWQQDAPIRCAAVERGRVYAVEKSARGPYRLVIRNAETGGLLRRELSYEAYDKIKVSRDLVFGLAVQALSVATLDGELVFEAAGPAALYEVAADGALYFHQSDPSDGARLTLSRWEPRGGLSQLLLKMPGPSISWPLANPGHMLYATTTRPKHLTVVYYDWGTKQERWRREVKFAAYANPLSLRETSVGLLMSMTDQSHFLFDAFTGAARVVPLSYKGPMFASKEAILLVKGQQLLAFAWK